MLTILILDALADAPENLSTMRDWKGGGPPGVEGYPAREVLAGLKHLLDSGELEACVYEEGLGIPPSARFWHRRRGTRPLLVPADSCWQGVVAPCLARLGGLLGRRERVAA